MGRNDREYDEDETMDRIMGIYPMDKPTQWVYLGTDANGKKVWEERWIYDSINQLIEDDDEREER